MKKVVCAAAGVAALLLANTATAEQGLKGGLGLGIPYGLLGGNLEYGFNDYVAATGGLGITPGGLGWAVGARAYFADTGKVRPRISAYHGVVAILETKNWWGGDSEYDTLTGEAFGIGLEWTMPSGFMLEFDLLAVNVDIPENATDETGKVKLSIGFSRYF